MYVNPLIVGIGMVFMVLAIILVAISCLIENRKNCRNKTEESYVFPQDNEHDSYVGLFEVSEQEVYIPADIDERY